MLEEILKDFILLIYFCMSGGREWEREIDFCYDYIFVVKFFVHNFTMRVFIIFTMWLIFKFLLVVIELIFDKWKVVIIKTHRFAIADFWHTYIFHIVKVLIRCEYFKCVCSNFRAFIFSNLYEKMNV